MSLRDEVWTRTLTLTTDAYEAFVPGPPGLRPLAGAGAGTVGATALGADCRALEYAGSCSHVQA